MKRTPAVGVAALWIGCVAVVAHVLYSTLGFNPTDDGFTLAYARRILDGQVPHRDFVIIRPVLSPILHLPEVWLGGSYTFWLSRLVFFLECACIAWFGTRLIDEGLGESFTCLEQSAFALIAFVFGCHSFPAMAWHTIDGLLLSVVGLYVRGRSSRYSAPVGYLLMGGAYLCKQSFFAMAPGALLIFGDWRKRKCVVAAVLPGVLYVGYLLVAGAIGDGREQLLSQTGIVGAGVRAYVSLNVLAGIAVGVAAIGLLYKTRGLGRAAGFSGIAAVWGLATWRLAGDGLVTAAFPLFGAVAGAVIALVLWGGDAPSREARTGLIVALLAWSASLSLGYNSPVLGAGMLLVFLLALAAQQLPATTVRWRAVGVLAPALLAVLAFHYVRLHSIYREQAATRLTTSLDDVLPGARLITTNPNTHAFLVDLNGAIEKAVASGLQYAIVPEVAAHWVKSKQPNPLPIDWAQGIELNTPRLLGRVTQSIEQRRMRQVVIVQKVSGSELAKGFLPIDTSRRRDPVWSPQKLYAVLIYVRTHLDKIGETRYFELYR